MANCSLPPHELPIWRPADRVWAGTEHPYEVKNDSDKVINMGQYMGWVRSATPKHLKGCP